MKQKLAMFVFKILVNWIANRRDPDFIVGADNPEGPYLLRWYITPWRGWLRAIPVNELTVWQARFLWVIKRLPNLYLHKFLRDDDDRAHHDHPSWAISYLTARGYIERTIAAGGIHHAQHFPAGALRFMPTKHVHRIELYRDADGNPLPAWSVFLFGPKLREWGFHCPERGWVHWEEFTARDDSGAIGRGCD